MEREEEKERERESRQRGRENGRQDTLARVYTVAEFNYPRVMFIQKQHGGVGGILLHRMCMR
jgi:hypothetical protein